MRRKTTDERPEARRETIDASRVSRLTPPRVSCLASRAPWKKAKLIELCKFQRGFDISKKEQRAGTIPVISSSGITSFHDTAKCKGPGVLVGRKGTLGTVHYCEGPYWPHSTALWVKDFKGNEPRFVYYYLKTLSFEHYDVGNANPTLNRNHVHLLDITLPPLSEQRRIVGILSAYDDLIENNRKRIALMEESARRLYKEWFVLLRFPGHERAPVEDGVPKGWKRTTVGEVCEVLYGKAHADIPDGDIPIVGSGGVMRKGDKALCSESSVLIPRKGSLGNIMLMEEPFWVVDTMFYTRMKLPNTVRWLYYSIQGMKLEERATGTAIPSMTTAILNPLPLRLPPAKILSKFSDWTNPFFSQIKTLRRESEKLAAARDALLSRLMKGDRI